jgi:hypothetical protein
MSPFLPRPSILHPGDRRRNRKQEHGEPVRNCGPRRITDHDEVARGIGSDSRHSPHFEAPTLKPLKKLGRTALFLPSRCRWRQEASGPNQGAHNRRLLIVVDVDDHSPNAVARSGCPTAAPATRKINNAGMTISALPPEHADCNEQNQRDRHQCIEEHSPKAFHQR